MSFGFSKSRVARMNFLLLCYSFLIAWRGGRVRDDYVALDSRVLTLALIRFLDVADPDSLRPLQLSSFNPGQGFENCPAVADDDGRAVVVNAERGVRNLFAGFADPVAAGLHLAGVEERWVGAGDAGFG